MRDHSFRWRLAERRELDGKRAVLAALQQHRGVDQAITAKRLSPIVKLSVRKVRAAVSELIAEGALIGASMDGEDGGYYLITNERELEQVRSTLRSRATEIFARDAALRKTWERTYGQRVQPLLPNISEA